MAFAFWFDPTAINGNYAEWAAARVFRGSAGIHVKNSQTGPKLLMLLLFLLLLLMEIAAEATKWPISTKKSNFSPSI